ncbi:winged helix DNA-binding domain-containing protein [Streptomyces aculeolatus]|uniref:winged helix DNA-binding domain-containing protein n=1 Tax=Streptomyces aculeolatus TaxID=270689 RepID=UPI001CEC8206|nr:winged helix DNA-binding domain-containing protein [Streptomyces aculeolatus]
MVITTAHRRARLARRQLLVGSARGTRPEEVAEALAGLHATDSPTVALSARARLREPSLAALDRALYEEVSLQRMHAMRRTLWVVPTDLVPVFRFAVAETVAARERALLLKQLATAGPQYDDAWLAAAQDRALAALAELGEASAAEVTAAVPELGVTYTLYPGKSYESRHRAGSGVMRVLGMEGRIRRTRPLGGWTSGQFRFAVAPPVAPVEPARARAELVRRWLAAFGPGTLADVKWWTGLPLGQVRAALAELAAAEVALDGGVGYVLPDDLVEDPDPGPWAALLPGLDPATMGWRDRDWYTDPAHRTRLFDSAGNAGPTVWWRGEIVGAWAQRRDGAVVHRLLADRGAEARRAVAEEAERLEGWLAAEGLVVSFPAPMSKELTG